MAGWVTSPCPNHEGSAPLPRREDLVLNVVAIVGPTAAGKSAVAETLAARFGATVVSVDSMQVYRGMDIGTAKPDGFTRERIDYRMLDVCDPDEELSVRGFQDRARQHIAEVLGSGGRVIIAGGSGLHFRSIVDPMTFAPTDRETRTRLEARPDGALLAELLSADPLAGDVVDLANPRRVLRALEVWQLTGRTPTQRAASAEAAALRRYEPVLDFVGFGIDGGNSLEDRIRSRLSAMVDAGFAEEVAGLQSRMGRTASQAVGYKEYSAALSGELSSREAFDETVRATNALVKRQRTFFRRDPRIRWISCQDGTEQGVEKAVTTIGEAMRWSS